MKNVLVIGSGGREHALVNALNSSASILEVFAAPGNPGMEKPITRLPDLDVTIHQDVIEAIKTHDIDFVVIGPEQPLIDGLTNTLTALTIPVFGPSQEAAMLEGSKSFAKEVMAAAGVDTARYWTGSSPVEAKAALADFDQRVVIKADGLAAGKGVVLCQTHEEAKQAIDMMMTDKAFGDAGNSIVIEEMMEGPECSLFGISDGVNVVMMESAQDFKRIGDNDTGLNTGGMGAYSPVPAVGKSVVNTIRTTVMIPVLREMEKRGTPFVGLLYAGLMLTKTGPRVVEFNARFGDPETQAILPRLTDEGEQDFGEILYKAAIGGLSKNDTLTFSDEACVTVVMASKGYPQEYETGKPIVFLEEAMEQGLLSEFYTILKGNPLPPTVYHAGTRKAEGSNMFVTNGGRVLAVSALGKTIEAARENAYKFIHNIRFEGAYFRKDIAENPTS